MRKVLQRLLICCALVGLLFPTRAGAAKPYTQAAAPIDNARSLLVRLTPEEKIGQLFIVSFQGPDASKGNAIYDLIVNYHIGGVMMIRENDNFLSPEQTATGAHNLIRQLQLNEFNTASQLRTTPDGSESFTTAYIPLLIALSQDGDGYPHDQILNGITVLPNPMTIGATWKPEQALKIGQVQGTELAAIGINLLIGPSLDVLDTPDPDSSGDIGVLAFGGDPYWVGQMGRAYIEGVHLGSENRIAVVAKNFPGFGGADRPPEEEVATVRKPLEQLKQIDLAPFFSVTGNSPGTNETTDALLVSHIRYQGFQDNIRDTTKPVSFDPEALQQITALEPLHTWREAGGLMISADLGSRAVRRFYDPSSQTFNSLFVARDAFLAGNDLLYVDDFTASGDPDSFTSIVRTLNYFAEKYRQDDAFAQRVDESVLRILTLKYRLYGGPFNINQILAIPADLTRLAQSDAAVLSVAAQSATLISPSQAELTNSLPSPPSREDKITFVTDTRTYQQCSRCKEQFIMPANALQQAVARLYSRGGQVSSENLLSYSFADLQNMLDVGTGIAKIENDLINADWIVFSMLDINPDVPASNALQNFLNQRPDLLRDKKLIVFAFNAPYFLDATDISKLTAYYSLYSHGAQYTSQFVDTAARLLFQEVRAVGISPVSVAGAGYDLNRAVFPNSEQIIQVSLDLPITEVITTTPEAETTPVATPLPTIFQIGDIVPVRTDKIVDYNGNHVPDGTVVRFTFMRAGDNPIIQQYESQTSQGVARASFRVDNPGRWEVRAESGDARQSSTLPFDAANPLNPETPAPTETASPEPTLSPTVEPTATEPPPSPTPTPEPEMVVPVTIDLNHWLTAIVLSAILAASTYLWMMRRSIRWGVRGALLVWAGGLLTYTYLAAGLPGSTDLIEKAQFAGVIGIVLIGGLAGMAIVLIWRRALRQKEPTTR